MNNKLYTIVNGLITLYVKCDYGGTRFEFAGFTVERDKEHVYMQFVSEYDKLSIKGRKCQSILEYLMNVYKTQADEQLQDYLRDHLNEYAIYENSAECFLYLLSAAGKEPVIRSGAHLKLDQVVNGIVGMEVNRITCDFNFIVGEQIGCRCGYHDELIDTTPMRIFYGEKLSQILAMEQYRRGVAPPVYTELARLSEFLEGKKSVKLVMKDGSVHEYKGRGDISIRSILEYTVKNRAGAFTLADRYYLKPSFNAVLPVDALDYLQYGKQQHRIDTEALNQFRFLAK